jgi:putative heme-binding domain-containing protein
MLELFGQIGESAAVEPVLGVAINKEEPKDIRRAALAAVQRFADTGIADKVLANYGEMEGDLRSNARNLLASRKPWAASLLAAVDAGRIDPKDFSTDQLKQLALFGDASFTAQIEKHWGKIEDQSPGEIRARIHGINVSLGLAPGDKGRGKGLFTKNCATCHTLFGEGNKIGPDLTSADRKNRTFLLTSIVDPSSVIRKEYIPYTIACIDGRLLTGIIVEGTPQTTTIVDAKNQRTVLSQEDIEEMKPSPKSLMPDRLLDELSAQEVRDLMSYLESDAP